MKRLSARFEIRVQGPLEEAWKLDRKCNRARFTREAARRIASSYESNGFLVKIVEFGNDGDRKVGGN